MRCPKCENRDTYCYFKDYFDGPDDERWWFLFDNECPRCGFVFESVKGFTETEEERLLDYDGTLFSENRKSRKGRF